MWLVAGLGNPGAKYEATRHNAGFIALDALMAKLGTTLSRSKFEGQYDKVSFAGNEVILARPMTFMNLSGKTVGGLAQFYHVVPERIIVIHDDLDLDPGRVLLRKGGSDGGHNGLKSIIASMGTRDFVRLRVGVGRPPTALRAAGGENPAVTGWVLGVPYGDEREAFQAACLRAAEAALSVVELGVAKAQNEINRRG